MHIFIIIYFFFIFYCFISKFNLLLLYIQAYVQLISTLLNISNNY